MELHEFVTTTLVQIQQGVQEAIAQSQQRGLKGAINPIWGAADRHDPNYVRDVAFDVAVTVIDRTEGSGGAAINVLSVKLGGEMSQGAENSHVSRVQFSIPLIAPVTEVGAD